MSSWRDSKETLGGEGTTAGSGVKSGNYIMQWFTACHLVVFALDLSPSRAKLHIRPYISSIHSCLPPCQEHPSTSDFSFQVFTDGLWPVLPWSSPSLFPSGTQFMTCLALLLSFILANWPSHVSLFLSDTSWYLIGNKSYIITIPR